MTPEERLATFLEEGRFADGDVAEGDEMLATATRLRGQLAMPEVWEAPPDGLLDLILADIERERQQGVAPGEADAPLAPVVDLPGQAPPTMDAPAVDTPAHAPGTETPADVPGSQPSSAPPTSESSGTVTPIPISRRARAVRWGAGLAAAAAVAAAAVIITAPQGEETEVALAGTSVMPGASATAILRDTDAGLEITLDVSGLDPLPEGYYYQAWLKGSRGSVTIGTFHAREGAGEVVLWSGVPLADYPTLTVTREPEDGNPASSGVVVMTSQP